MKLRFQAHSIRLRLKRTEVDELAKSHRVEEEIALGHALSDTFRYALEATREVFAPTVALTNRGLLVRVPLETAVRWATGPEVGIEAALPASAGADSEVRLLIEKDFACLHGGTEEDNEDTFAHPLAGKPA